MKTQSKTIGITAKALFDVLSPPNTIDNYYKLLEQFNVSYLTTCWESVEKLLNKQQISAELEQNIIKLFEDDNLLFFHDTQSQQYELSLYLYLDKIDPDNISIIVHNVIEYIKLRDKLEKEDLYNIGGYNYYAR